ncbi:hypothetical protein GCM10027035_23490 [Emticicia sediminis]
MKRQLTLLAFILVSTFAQANTVEDSLIANIGKKAKVIFYAENKVDLNEIAKYDLNKLFAEVRKRSEKNFSNNEEVTLREADELKNREVNTTVSTKKWLKNMNLNLFVGKCILGPNYIGFIGNREDIILPNSQIAGLNSGSFLEADGGVFLGIGGFYDKKIINNRFLKSALRYGYGIDFMNPRVLSNTYFSYSKYSFTNSNFSIDPITQSVIDSLAYTQRVRQTFSTTNNKTARLPTTTIYFQFMPNFYLNDRAGKKTWNFGAGLKLGLNVNSFISIFKNSYIAKHPSLWNSAGAEILFYDTSEYIPVISNRYTLIQKSLTFNVGYKYLNFFYHLNLGNLHFFGFPNIKLDPKSNTYKPNSLSSVSQNHVSNTHSFGLRFGK